MVIMNDIFIITITNFINSVHVVSIGKLWHHMATEI